LPDTAPTTTDPLAQAREEIAAYEAVNHPPVKPPAPEATNGKADSKPVEEATAKSETPEAAVSTEQVTTGDSAQATPAEEAVDLSFFPEEVRTGITVKDKAVANKLKSGWMGHAKVTQGLQEIAAIKRDAENWRAAKSDPVKAAKIVKIMMGEDVAPEASVEEDLPDPALLDGKGFREVIQREAAKIVAAERAKMAEEAQAPTRHYASLNTAISTFAEAKDIAPEAMKAAVAAWKSDLAENGVGLDSVNPVAIPALLAPYVRLTRVTPVKATPQTNAGVPNGRAGGLSEVASPNGRAGSSAGSTVVVPDHVRQGRPAANAAEYDAEMEYAFKKRFGSDVNQG